MYLIQKKNVTEVYSYLSDEFDDRQLVGKIMSYLGTRAYLFHKLGERKKAS